MKPAYRLLEWCNNSYIEVFDDRTVNYSVLQGQGSRIIHDITKNTMQRTQGFIISVCQEGLVHEEDIE